MSRDKGSSLFELLVGLTLSGMITATIVSSIHAILRAEKEAGPRAEELALLIRLEEVFWKAMKDRDSHRLETSPRIHRRGVLTFTSGRRLRVSPQAKLRTKRESDALTSLRLSAPHMRRVKLVQRVAEDDQGVATILTSCPVIPDSPPPQIPFQSYLGLTVDAIYELKVTELSTSPPDTGCGDLNLVATRSMTAAPPPERKELLLHLRVLLPIREHFTLYLDNRDTLRYLHHRGAQTVENQPILTGISSLKLSPRHNFGGDILSIGVQVETTLGREYSFEVAHTLPSRGPLTLLALTQRW